MTPPQSRAFGILLGGESRRTDEVGEQDRHELALLGHRVPLGCPAAAGRSADCRGHVVAATPSPLAAVSAATITIAVDGDVASATTPAIRAPSTKPKSRQKR